VREVVEEPGRIKAEVGNNCQVRSILVVGPPRSSTTWVANILAKSAVDLVLEPDNEKTSLLALLLKNGVPRFPTTEHAEGAKDYQLLWKLAFDSSLAPMLSRSLLTKLLLKPFQYRIEDRLKKVTFDRANSSSFSSAKEWISGRFPRKSGIRIVKSVHSVFCLDWLIGEQRPDKTLIVMRDPRAILASWKRLSLLDGVRAGLDVKSWFFDKGVEVRDEFEGVSPQYAESVKQLSAMFFALTEALEKRENVKVVWHEDLCASSMERFADVYEGLGLDWSENAETAIRKNNRDGKGFRPQRLASQELGKWKGVLTREELFAAERHFESIGVSVRK